MTLFEMKAYEPILGFGHCVLKFRTCHFIQSNQKEETENLGWIYVIVGRRRGVSEGGDPCSFYRWRWPPTEKRRQPCCGWSAALSCCGLGCCTVLFLPHSTGLRYTRAFSLAALFSTAECQCVVTYQSTVFCEVRPEPATTL